MTRTSRGCAAPLGASGRERTAAGTISVVHPDSPRDCTTQSQGDDDTVEVPPTPTGTAARAVGRISSIERPPLVRTEIVGAAGEPTLSHVVAGTSAGCAYGPAVSRSTSASGFSKNTFMLKCTLPVAPACARVSRICSRISLVRHRKAGSSIFPV